LCSRLYCINCFITLIVNIDFDMISFLVLLSICFPCFCALLLRVNSDSSFWQSCRTLLELMVLDKHLTVRKMYQSKFGGGPSMLENLIGSKSCQRKWVCAEHFFANPMSTSLL
jgi:hypothetical protein